MIYEAAKAEAQRRANQFNTDQAIAMNDAGESFWACGLDEYQDCQLEVVNPQQQAVAAMKQAFSYWIIPKNGNPPWIIRAAGDDQNAKDTAVAWWGVVPDSFYVSRVD